MHEHWADFILMFHDILTAVRKHEMIKHNKDLNTNFSFHATGKL